MRIVVSLLGFRPGRIGGTETYLRRMIDHLPVAAAPDEVLFIADCDLARMGIVPAEHLATLSCSGREILAKRALEAMSPYRAKGVERFFATQRPDVILFPQQSIFPKFVDAASALVVHDLYHLCHPEHLSVVQRTFRNASYQHSLSLADQVIAISRTTRQSIIDRCGVSAERIVAIPHGYDPPSAFAPSVTCPIEGRFLYYPASSYPHKNHCALFATVALLREAGEFPYRLVLSGLQTRHWKALSRQIRRLGLHDTVVHLGFVSYAVVSSLYQNAECVVFPSLYEGFGIPVLEAISHQKKIVCSRAPIFDELGVARQFQIDFSVPGELLHALKATPTMHIERRHLSWRQSMQLMARVLRSTAPDVLEFANPNVKPVHATASARHPQATAATVKIRRAA